MNVTVYSTPTCPYCKLAKNFLNERYGRLIQRLSKE